MKTGVNVSVGGSAVKIGVLVSVGGVFVSVAGSAVAVKIGMIVGASVGRGCPVIPNPPRQAPVRVIAAMSGRIILRNAGIVGAVDSL
jgi:hypothetical protein